MQKLLGGSLECPAQKGTEYPQAAAPKAKCLLQVDDGKSPELGFLVCTSRSCEECTHSISLFLHQNAAKGAFRVEAPILHGTLG